MRNPGYRLARYALGRHDREAHDRRLLFAMDAFVVVVELVAALAFWVRLVAMGAGRAREIAEAQQNADDGKAAQDELELHFHVVVSTGWQIKRHPGWSRPGWRPGLDLRDDGWLRS
jgi:hypothetical protein